MDTATSMFSPGSKLLAVKAPRTRLKGSRPSAHVWARKEEDVHRTNASDPTAFVKKQMFSTKLGEQKQSRS